LCIQDKCTCVNLLIIFEKDVLEWFSGVHFLFLDLMSMWPSLFFTYGGGTGFRSPNIKICFETFHRINNFNWPFRAFTLISYKLIFMLEMQFRTHVYLFCLKFTDLVIDVKICPTCVFDHPKGVPNLIRLRF
jgi:hypothetical protein